MDECEGELKDAIQKFIVNQSVIIYPLVELRFSTKPVNP